jgi:hypothetical protein
MQSPRGLTQKQSKSIPHTVVVREFNWRRRLVHHCVSEQRPKLKIAHVAADPEAKRLAQLGSPLHLMTNRQLVPAVTRRTGSGQCDWVVALTTARDGGTFLHPQVP